MSNPVAVVAGGTSIKNIDLGELQYKNIDIITVNKSVFSVGNPKYMITMDYTFLRKIDVSKLMSINTTKVFVANFSKDYIQNVDGRIVDKRTNLIYDLKNFDMIVKSYRCEGMGVSFNDFRNGECSGFCGLQFAVLMGYNPIYLFGVDLVSVDGNTHFHGGYGESEDKFNRKLEVYYNNFVTGIDRLKQCLPSVSIYSCSKVSRLNNIIEYREIKDVR